MVAKILMPALSPTMTEGNLTKWLVKEGDSVKAGDLLAEIETDKATMEVEAVDEGVVTNILVKEGSTSVSVNTTIAILDGVDDLKNEVSEVNKISELSESSQENQESQENKKLKNENSFDEENIKESIQKNSIKTNIKGNKFIASPYAKKLAKEKNINLDIVFGTGPNGRIVKKDLENNDTKLNNVTNNLSNSIEPSSMRKIIAEKTTLTKQTVPHFYLTIDSNVDKLLEMRKNINQNYNLKISINDILVKSLALAQKRNPLTNISWIDGKIIKYKTIDVSIAVALDEGLVTPIVKNADIKGLKEISNEIKYLVDKAKKGRLIPDDYVGGTISISNLGMFGISEFSAIINPPQSSILAVGTIKKTPIIINDEIKISNILKSTLSADHRALDGAVAGKLLKDFNDIIEDPFDLWLKSSDMELI